MDNTELLKDVESQPVRRCWNLYIREVLSALQIRIIRSMENEIEEARGVLINLIRPHIEKFVHINNSKFLELQALYPKCKHIWTGYSEIVIENIEFENGNIVFKWKEYHWGEESDHERTISPTSIFNTDLHCRLMEDAFKTQEAKIQEEEMKSLEVEIAATQAQMNLLLAKRKAEEK